MQLGGSAETPAPFSTQALRFAIGLLANAQIAAAKLTNEAARAAHLCAAVQVCCPAERVTVELLSAVVDAHRPIREAAGDTVPLRRQETQGVSVGSTVAASRMRDKMSARTKSKHGSEST